MSKPKATRRLVEAILRAYVYDIIRCKKDLNPKDINFWESQWVINHPRGKKIDIGSYDHPFTELLLACSKRKGQLQNHSRGNPENLQTLLLYKICHGVKSSQQEKEDNPRCPACGGEVDRDKQKMLLSKINNGYRLQELKDSKTYDDFIERCDGFVNTHLTEKQISSFVGHEVNIREQMNNVEKLK